MRAALVGTLVYAGFAAATFGQAETFDAVSFVAPAGWERLPGKGALGFRAPDGGAQVFLFPSQRSAGSPEENFRADWERLVTPALGKIPAPVPQREARRDGWTGMHGAGAKGAGLAVVLLTATGEGRSMSVVATVTGTKAAGAMQAFFASLAFWAQAPAAAADSPEGVSGLFAFVQAGMVSGARLEVRTWMFLPGGRITRTFPFGDGATFDAARCNPDMCGTYTLSPGRLVVRWENGRTDEWAYAAGADGITLDGRLFRRARAVTAAMLAGVWGNEGNVYRFAPDGTFTFGTSAGGLGGRYRVDGLSLVLSFADGTQQRRALFAASPGDPPGLVCIEGEVFARR